MDERLDYLIGERIGEVLNEAESRRKKHYKEEAAYLKELEEKDRETVDKLLEDQLD